MRSCLHWALLSLASLVSAFAQETWTQQSSPTTQDLWSVSNAGPGTNGFVAVGTAGTILTSPNGTTWTARNSGTTNWLVGITYGNGLYVAVGDQGIILTSPDGINWTVRVSGGGNRLNGIAWSGRQFLAVGEGGTVASSSDGITWTTGSAGTTNWLHGVAWDFTRQFFWVTGQGGTLLTTKGDGTFISQVSGTTQDLEAADANVYISGIGNPSTIKLAGTGGYLAVTNFDPSILTLSPYSAISTAHFQGVGFFGGEFIAVGSSGTIAIIYSGETNWHTVTSGVTTTLYGVTASATMAVAVGQSGSIVTSPYHQGAPYSAVIATSGVPALGAPLALSVSASGQDPQTYQWSLNGQTIAGATSSTLSLPSLQGTQTGNYSVKISNAIGSTTATYIVSATYHPSIPGLVDESFTPVLNNEYLSVLAIQSDGKLLAVLNSTSGTIFNQQLVRFLSDGTVDAVYTSALAKNFTIANGSFGGGYPGGVGRLIQQRDGKLIVAGTFKEGGTAGYQWNQSWRVNTDGTLDSTYTPHIASFPVPGVSQDLIPQVQLEDGRYLTIGPAGIVRLLANGAVDATFASYTPPGPNLTTTNWQLVSGVSGKVFSERTNSGGSTTIDRLNGDGTLDSSFTSTAAQGQIVQVLPSGQPIVIGRNANVIGGVQTVTTGTLTIQRLNLNGTIDATYSGLSLPFSINGSGIPWQILATTLGSDGSLYVDLSLDSASLTPVPVTLVQGTFHQGIIRIDPSGNFDPAYSLNFDLQATPSSALPTGLSSTAAGLVALSNGQFYFWNAFIGFNGEARQGLVRINPSVGSNFASLANLSARGSAGQGASALTVGFVQSGPANKTMLLRGIGPGLAAFGVPGALPDPLLTLFDPTASVQLINNDWQDGGQGPAITAIGTAVGAFALTNGSLDAALITSLAPGAHTFAVSGAGATTGIALAEAYDADSTLPVSGGARAINFSLRAPVTNSSAVLTAGFVVTGSNLKHVLVRAIGPSLAAFNVGTPIPDPVLTVFAGTLAIAQNQQWGGQAALSSTFTDVAAFALPSASADSAVVLNLPPGGYTAQVTSASGASGLTLIEIYEVL